MNLEIILTVISLKRCLSVLIPYWLKTYQLFRKGLKWLIRFLHRKNLTSSKSANTWLGGCHRICLVPALHDTSNMNLINIGICQTFQVWQIPMVIKFIFCPWKASKDSNFWDLVRLAFKAQTPLLVIPR